MVLVVGLATAWHPLGSRDAHMSGGPISGGARFGMQCRRHSHQDDEQPRNRFAWKPMADSPVEPNTPVGINFQPLFLVLSKRARRRCKLHLQATAERPRPAGKLTGPTQPGLASSPDSCPLGPTRAGEADTPAACLVRSPGAGLEIRLAGALKRINLLRWLEPAASRVYISRKLNLDEQMRELLARRLASSVPRA